MRIQTARKLIMIVLAAGVVAHVCHARGVFASTRSHVAEPEAMTVVPYLRIGDSTPPAGGGAWIGIALRSAESTDDDGEVVDLIQAVEEAGDKLVTSMRSDTSRGSDRIILVEEDSPLKETEKIRVGSGAPSRGLRDFRVTRETWSLVPLRTTSSMGRKLKVSYYYKGSVVSTTRFELPPE